MSAGDLIAVYAALVATGVLIWDIIKWRSSERLKLTGFTSSNMKTFGSATTPETEGNTYTVVRIQNRGGVPCTVQLVTLVLYKNIFAQWRGKPSKQAFVNHTGNFGPALPYRLEKGAEFSSGVLQDSEFEEMTRKGRLFIGIGHTMGKPFYVRVKPIVASK